MDKVYYNYLNYVYGIYQRYSELKNEYESMPEGRLEIVNTKRDGIKYYIYLNKTRTYLSPKRKDIIDLMLKKGEVELTLKKAERILKMLNNPALSEIAKTPLKKIKDFPVSVSEETFKREELKHKTAHGEYVRTKSEVIIANILYDLGIPYVYEKKLKTKEGVVYPDFTVKHPYTENVYYIEHAGMLDKPDYAADFCVKLSKYKSIGISEDNYLIVTTEEKGVIDTKVTKNILEKRLTFRRFLSLLKL